MRWVVGAGTRGTVALFPGRAEFIEKYFEVVGELLARRFEVVIMDWRGQGQSDRELANARKGHIDDFAIYARDLKALLHQVMEPFCPKTLVCACPFHGGRDPCRARPMTIPRASSGWCSRRRCSTSTCRGFAKVCRPWQRPSIFSALGGAFIPGGGVTSIMSKPFEGNVLTSDPARFDRTARALTAVPQLGIGDPTIGWLNAAFRLMRQFADPDYPRRTLTPLLIIAAGDDKVVRTPMIEAFASLLKAGRFITIPHARHEILMERDPIREQFWAAFDAFVPGELEAAKVAAQ